jgi:hypothetical protein
MIEKTEHKNKYIQIEGFIKPIEDPIETFGVFDKKDNHFDYLVETLRQFEGKEVIVTISRKPKAKK